MPTFNQLVRKGRQTLTVKSTAPALQKGLNYLKKRPTKLRRKAQGQQNTAVSRSCRLIKELQTSRATPRKQKSGVLYKHSDN